MSVYDVKSAAFYEAAKPEVRLRKSDRRSTGKRKGDVRCARGGDLRNIDTARRRDRDAVPASDKLLGKLGYVCLDPADTERHCYHKYIHQMRFLSSADART